MQIDLQKIIINYPNCLKDSSKLKAMLMDVYPTVKRGYINTIITIQTCGILAEIIDKKKIEDIDVQRWIKNLVENFFIVDSVAKECIELWINALVVEDEIEKENKQREVYFKQRLEKVDFLEKILEKIDGSANLHVFDIKDNELISFRLSPANIVDYNMYNYRYFLHNGEKFIDVYVPRSVKKIKSYAFANKDFINSIIIPDNVEEIENDIFDDCNELQYIYLGSGIKKIGHHAFFNCDKLKRIKINNVEILENNIFDGCMSLNKVLLWAGIKEIKSCAFIGCVKLKEIIFKGTTKMWDKIKKDGSWNTDSAITVIHCTDGDINIK